MTLKGHGAVAIWHNLLPEARDEFYQWHGREHMPERVAIPGFIRGRRYVALTGGLEYFNLYEADTATTLGGAEYLQRLNNPTPWTQKVVASFRDVARSTCAVHFSEGIGDGGYIRTVALTAIDESSFETLLDSVLRPLAALSGVSGVHFLIADEAMSNIETRERAARGDATAVPRHIVLIEGVSQRHVEAASDRFAGALGAGTNIDAATYVLEHATER